MPLTQVTPRKKMNTEQQLETWRKSYNINIKGMDATELADALSYLNTSAISQTVENRTKLRGALSRTSAFDALLIIAQDETRGGKEKVNKLLNVVLMGSPDEKLLCGATLGKLLLYDISQQGTTKQVRQYEASFAELKGNIMDKFMNDSSKVVSMLNDVIKKDSKDGIQKAADILDMMHDHNPELYKTLLSDLEKAIYTVPFDNIYEKTDHSRTEYEDVIRKVHLPGMSDSSSSDPSSPTYSSRSSGSPSNSSASSDGRYGEVSFHPIGGVGDDNPVYYQESSRTSHNNPMYTEQGSNVRKAEQYELPPTPVKHGEKDKKRNTYDDVGEYNPYYARIAEESGHYAAVDTVPVERNPLYKVHDSVLDEIRNAMNTVGVKVGKNVHNKEISPTVVNGGQKDRTKIGKIGKCNIL